LFIQQKWIPIKTITWILRFIKTFFNSTLLFLGSLTKWKNHFTIGKNPALYMEKSWGIHCITGDNSTLIRHFIRQNFYFDQ